jgi:hypothetical protein
VDLCSRCTEVVDPCRLPRRIPADMRWVLDPDEGAAVMPPGPAHL